MDQIKQYNLFFKRIKPEGFSDQIVIFINEERLKISWKKDSEKFLIGNVLQQIIEIVDCYIKEYEEEKNIKTNITFEDIKQAYLKIGNIK